MDTPLVSIILSSFNGSQTIEQTILSVLAQDYRHFELIIIDDASTDNLSDILKKYAQIDSHIRVYRNEKNQKLVASLNRWIELSKGEYIARIDDDDIWIDPSKLTKQVHILQSNPHVWVVGTFGVIINEKGQETGKKIIHPTRAEEVKKWFGLKNCLIHTSILARKSVLAKAWFYRSEWLYAEDFDLWLRVLALGYSIINLPDYCVQYRVRSWSITQKKYRKMQWLTFLRLFHDRAIYSSFSRKVFCLSIRFLLILMPRSILNLLK